MALLIANNLAIWSSRGQRRERWKIGSRGSVTQAQRALSCIVDPHVNGVHLVTAEKEEARFISPEIDHSIAELQQGKCVVVKGSTSVLITPARMATTERIRQMAEQATGVIAVAMESEELDKLQLARVVAGSQPLGQSNYVLSIQAAKSSQIESLEENIIATIRALCQSEAKRDDFVSPGNILPLQCRKRENLDEYGYAEAASDLQYMAGIGGPVVLCEIDSRSAIPEFPVVDVSLVEKNAQNFVQLVAKARLPTKYGNFEIYNYENRANGKEIIAMVQGQVKDAEECLVRFHSECMTGDVFGSVRCDCGDQLHAALRRISKEGRGVVVYITGHEGRGIGLSAKLQAYNLQDEGHDTVDANLELGLPIDSRDYSSAIGVIRDLRIKSIRLITNNPTKIKALKSAGVNVVDRVSLTTPINPHSKKYMETKQARMGHIYDL